MKAFDQITPQVCHQFILVHGTLFRHFSLVFTVKQMNSYSYMNVKLEYFYVHIQEIEG